MDAPTHTFADLESFLVAIDREGIRSVVVRSIHEIRPRTLAGHQVEVAEQRWTELVAYRGGTLFTARLEGASAASVEASLRGRGLTIRAVRGNLG